MKPISNRYELSRLLGPLHNGMLYEGKDLSLQRTVFVYAIDAQGESAARTYIRGLGSAAEQGASESPFLHILDVEVGRETIHVIISYKPGCSLEHLIRNHPPSFREAISMVADLGQALLDAAEERLLDFSIEANNIWITENGMINVINTWDRPANDQRLSKGLSMLLLQLLARTTQVPANGDPAFIRKALAGLPTDRTEQIIGAVTDAYTERITLASFVRFLRLLPYAKSAEWPPQTNLEAISIPHGMPIPKAEADQEFDEDEEENEEPASFGKPLSPSATRSRPRWLRLGKKLTLGLSLSVLGIAVFAGVFALLVETMNRGPKHEPSTPNIIAEQRPQTNAQEKENPPAKTVSNPTEPPAESAGGTLVSVPTLTGLTQEAAGKLAVETGLHFQFFLEPNKQTAGTVFKQEPAPNQQVEKGSSVTFWVSKGPSQQ